ncbi:MAG: calcium/sodium antiporter [Bacteroidaceae bacterium]|nr:calcium/sodium antiporter [Bacteroidaceae bacterium]
MLLDIIFVLLGFVLLIKGGDWLVEGAVSIAKWAKLSPMVIGLTVIGFGTSAPELFVSLQAALAGSPGICLGNVVGSNIANIGLILGVTALITPCIIKNFTLKVDLPMMLLACWLLVAVGMSGTIGRLAGAVGVCVLIMFVTWEVRRSRRITKMVDSNEENEESSMVLWKAILLSVFALGLLVGGSHILVNGASGIAREIGAMVGADPRDMERIIGLTIVAVGTSFPELFASVIAARKGQQDMAIGNIVGSVTFNVLFGIGLPALICPIHGTDIGFLRDYLIMGGLAVLLWFFMFTKRTLERWEGLVLLLIYISYIGYLIVA